MEVGKISIFARAGGTLLCSWELRRRALALLGIVSAARMVFLFLRHALIG